MFSHALGREEHHKQISLACVGSARSVWATLGLPPFTLCVLSHSTLLGLQVALQGSCLKGALGCMHVRGLSGFRSSGTPHRHRLGWACVLCPSQGSSGDQVLGMHALPAEWWSYHLPGPRPLVSWAHHLRCAVCLLWGADLCLQPSWRMSTIQDPRKTWLATGSLFTGW